MIHEAIRIYGYRNKVKYSKEDRKNMVEYANKVIKIYHPDAATITRFIKIKRISFGFVSKPEYLLLFENSKGALVAFIYKENNSEEDIDSISNQINEIIENFIMFGLRYNYIVYGLETYVIFPDNIDVGDEKIFLSEEEYDFVKTIYLADKMKVNKLKMVKKEINGKCSLMQFV